MIYVSRQPRIVPLRSVEQLDARLCLSAVLFDSHDIVVTEVEGAMSVFAADVDGDGDMDVLSASFWNDKIAWYENTDGKGSFGEQKVITTAARGAVSVYAADVDGDGDMDVLSASQDGPKIAWYENTDGKGTFGPQQVITTAVRWANSVYAADIDGDGDVDVLSASSGDDKIAWYENTDGKGSFGKQHAITTTADLAASVHAADIDGDGDIDVLSAAWLDNKIAWYENTDGKGTFSDQKIITTLTSGARSVYAADVDADGDVDVLSASHNDNKIAWYENTDGKGSFGQQQVITLDAEGANSVYAADVDGDGDVDVLSTSELDDKVAWYENTDGTGSFGEQKVITTKADNAYSVYAADIDGDGDIDVLSASLHDSKIAWYEQLPRMAAGDANRDLQFDQQDIIQVLRVAKFLTGEPATFEEGDWNNDGIFNQDDIILAMQTGNYLQGPYASLAKSARDADVDSVFDELGLWQFVRPV